MRIGRKYDKLGKKAKGKIVYVIPGGAICKIISDGIKSETVENKDNCESTEEE